VRSWSRPTSGFSRAFFAALVNTSTEYRENVVFGLYESVLERPADPGGLQLFVSLLSHGARNELCPTSASCSAIARTR
jgi:hypothetical protein